MAHIRQPRPDSGLGFQAKVLETFQGVPSSLDSHPGGNPGANLKSISHRCYPILVSLVREWTKGTINFPLGYLQVAFKVFRLRSTETGVKGRTARVVGARV